MCVHTCAHARVPACVHMPMGGWACVLHVRLPLWLRSAHLRVGATYQGRGSLRSLTPPLALCVVALCPSSTHRMSPVGASGNSWAQRGCNSISLVHLGQGSSWGLQPWGEMWPCRRAAGSSVSKGLRPSQAEHCQDNQGAGGLASWARVEQGSPLCSWVPLLRSH